MMFFFFDMQRFMMKSISDNKARNEFNKQETYYYQNGIDNIFSARVEFRDKEIIIKIKEDQDKHVNNKIPLKRRNAEKIFL